MCHFFLLVNAYPVSMLHATTAGRQHGMTPVEISVNKKIIVPLPIAI